MEVGQPCPEEARVRDYGKAAHASAAGNDFKNLSEINWKFLLKCIQNRKLKKSIDS